MSVAKPNKAMFARIFGWFLVIFHLFMHSLMLNIVMIGSEFCCFVLLLAGGALKRLLVEPKDRFLQQFLHFKQYNNSIKN
jgi:hypothetical protein